MADDSTGELDASTESAALRAALAAEHAAVWGYGVVGAALGAGAASAAGAAETAHRDLRDRVTALLAERKVDAVPAEGGYGLPFPVLSEVDAAALAAVLEEGTEAAWVRVLDQSVERSTRELAVEALSTGEIRAVAWRTAAGQVPVTRAFPGLPT